ncbi:cupin domain-containing protein [Kitasatospora sp. HPMI-4]|uniref:cupin domain-containing protein n=1 Tax=Kitasatospora sp. HPMI-4 TaxID=3448443 RepID=UPI003F1AFF04
MTPHGIRRLDELDRLTLRHGDVSTALNSAVEEANNRARSNAAGRLRAQLGDRVTAALAERCTEPALGTSKDGPSSLNCGRQHYEQWLTAEPRLIAATGTGANADMELRDAHGKLLGERFGNRLEPDSDTFQMDIHRVRQALADGITLGIRQFDRWSTQLAELVDDIVAVSGADVFTKLFISAGTTSVTGWHSDRQDVIALMLWGNKRFQLGDWGTPEGGPPNKVVLDEVLHQGDSLLFPEGHPHQAIPLGDDSGLLSIALLRRHNWISRNQIPSHLGVAEHPPSDAAYRRLLRSRIRPAAQQPELTGGSHLRSLVPGGIELLSASASGEIIFAANGGVFAANTEAVTLLAAIHSMFPTTLREAGGNWLPEAVALTAVSLIEAGLIALSPH